jgi:hypothetical protein
MAVSRVGHDVLVAHGRHDGRVPQAVHDLRSEPPAAVDAEGRQWPWTKLSDDATAVYLVLADG